MADNSVPIRDESIRLGQFLKLADAVDQGSDVKRLLAAGDVSVNGVVETRRGRRLGAGDEVGVHTTTYRVTVDRQGSLGGDELPAQRPSGKNSSGS